MNLINLKNKKPNNIDINKYHIDSTYAKLVEKIDELLS